MDGATMPCLFSLSWDVLRVNMVAATTYYFFYHLAAARGMHAAESPVQTKPVLSPAGVHAVRFYAS